MWLCAKKGEMLPLAGETVCGYDGNGARVSKVEDGTRKTRGKRRPQNCNQVAPRGGRELEMAMKVSFRRILQYYGRPPCAA